MPSAVVGAYIQFCYHWSRIYAFSSCWCLHTALFSFPPMMIDDVCNTATTFSAQWWEVKKL